MAVVNSLSTPFLITKSFFTTRTTRLPVHRQVVFASIHENISNPISSSSSSSSTTTITTTTPCQIKSTSKNGLKVFEDTSTGVVCYRDEYGEITCEGYDEGPRFCHQPPKSPSKSRDEEIVELLQRNWLHIAVE
ncbi:hypothetical protein MTR67_050782 [Solanum verrucosum]|uniref:Uncharacterized protein n=1 Tax=Solanum verrucosum TaxID=315347 RepID=A0AAF0V325_SOLVR|nr:uncharacterized protein LOC125820157 [Solanum verrucosum]WMV57397.1 hypothetical protein MTR67_050782 [Solanum verrucosum]